MPRYRATIEYNGSEYVGWQKQENGISIQESFENAIKKQTNQEVEVFAAGRTDSGVHALGQVVHFDLKNLIPTDTIRDGLNQHLRPQPISILQVKEASDDFHARFSAIQRHYEYVIINRRSPLTVQKGLAWLVHKNLDVALMQEGAKFFIGKNDLNAFRSINCQSKTSIKTIDHIEIFQKNNYIKINIKAKSFLHSQVRIMVGTLVYVGEGKIQANEIKKIISEKKREKAGPTAPADGLYLKNVYY
ncbi:MAG: tRNA pseudouridine synthase A [Alphaproteobacteria bacterium MarineAlpha5_Bin11]|nr:tRNA pseudouridine(38-40) synthase TruA [Pelagibacteraceae bacterium]PPR44792.1 MAG: tRNA pseudouridine synthase A [Alphaproteobacteria bacterium MarineAlpha5_Bin11]PPR50225.1 MAG: tRNA pseudouridine synthase A [Alphaproteobacteria bacterium MarineAlpha5_Bin10]|tara:strand:+ start:278 stop:1015 length:738 start_codon:yes stop_codon:yes gene_type:complete